MFCLSLLTNHRLCCVVLLENQTQPFNHNGAMIKDWSMTVSHLQHKIVQSLLLTFAKLNVNSSLSV